MGGAILGRVFSGSFIFTRPRAPTPRRGSGQPRHGQWGWRGRAGSLAPCRPEAPTGSAYRDELIHYRVQRHVSWQAMLPTV
jgi:hypothetical protein